MSFPSATQWSKRIFFDSHPSTNSFTSWDQDSNNYMKANPHGDGWIFTNKLRSSLWSTFKTVFICSVELGQLQQSQYTRKSKLQPWYSVGLALNQLFSNHAMKNAITCYTFMELFFGLVGYITQCQYCLFTDAVNGETDCYIKAARETSSPRKWAWSILSIIWLTVTSSSALTILVATLERTLPSVPSVQLYRSKKHPGAHPYPSSRVQLFWP